ncbi:dehydrogenase/reductase SDR family member on chromosome X-like [Osmia bicornis bicornis]|uniref:dehydrogenase/reductase SDR family member on chromosome X-like n=1 Tax=Osmia bicornis bicornis TaxID=1437191 RepID=UPI0010F93C2A|nr:dehydrogenase/reductase SDR family member on chromosome X-like [Osmia bicornis bicornis]
MLFIGSIFAVIASAFIYRSSRENWPVLLEICVLQIEYGLLAVKEIIFDLVNRKNNKNDCTLQTGRIAIITGGSRGLGVEVVKMLLELDMEVLIACRTPSAGEKVILQIRESGVKSGQAKVYKLDNASLDSVKQFALEIKRDYKQIHVLVNNAGIMFYPYDETVEGFEQQWGVNYLSHFLLTALLLPLLKAGGLPQQSSRIVNVTSCAHLLGKINFSDINSKNRFLSMNAYSQSKLAQVVFTKWLQNILKEKQYHVQAYTVHPGIVNTELFVNSYLWHFRSIIRYILKNPKEGATPVVYAAVNKAIEDKGGIYINNCISSPFHPDAENVSIQKQLLDLSLQQVKLSDFFEYVS